MPTNPPDDIMTPTEAAKKLGIKPQIIFSWVKKGKVSNQALQGETTRISLEEVRKASTASPSRAPNGQRRSGGGGKKGVKSPVKKHDVISWPKQEKGKDRRVVQVTGTDNQLTYLRDTSGRTFEFRNLSLKELIANGTARIEEPWALLRCVAVQLAKSGDRDAAKSLAGWIMEHEPKKPELGAVPEPEAESKEVVAVG